MKKHRLIIKGILLLASASIFETAFANVPFSPPSLDNLLLASEQILNDVDDQAFGNNCTTYLKTLESAIDALDVTKLPDQDLNKYAEDIAHNSWLIRGLLHSKLPQFDKDCVFQVQTTFRQLRLVEDYLLEFSRKTPHLGPKDIDFQSQPVPLRQFGPSFYELKQYKQTELQPGDLLITRGVSFLSGMIARLGERPTQFSHVVMVYKDKDSSELKTIESYVGTGVGFYEMDFALKNENVRILWLRAKDATLGANAAKEMSQSVSDRIKAKNHIKYDYKLDFNNPQSMSCAEVSQVAFEMASAGTFRIPFYPNRVAAAKDLVERLKLNSGNIYEPGDMEIDPRFELIGEFRDLRLTRDSRQKDAIMTKIFEWMENKNYVLKDNLKSRMAGGFIYKVRRTFLWPLVKKMLKLEDFSKEIPANMLQTMTLMNSLGEQMLAELQKRDLAFEKKFNVPMGQIDLYTALEEMRQKDLELYKNKKTRKLARLHNLFRSK